MKKIRIDGGTVIFRQNDSGNTMYMIRGGRIGIYVGYGTARQKKLAELEPGTCFGEMALIEEEPRSATAVALETSEVDEISAEEFDVFVRENPELMVLLLRHMSARLRETTNRYLEACGTISEMERNGNRSTGLMEKIRRFIREFDESQISTEASYLNSFLFY